METTALYESVFAIMVSAMVFISLIVIAAGYFVLKRWASVWRKAAIVHSCNFAVLLSATNPLAAHIPLAGFLRLLNYSIVLFAISLFLVDACRILTKRNRSFGTGHLGRFATLGLMLIVFVIGMVVVRMTADSAQGKRELHRYRAAVAVMDHLNRISPEREMIVGLRKHFPEEFKLVMGDYSKQVDRALLEKNAPEFPRDRVHQFVRSRQLDISRAPDADLIELAQATAKSAEQMVAADLDGHCLLNATGTLRADHPYAAAPASPDLQRAVGAFVAASLSAARAGIDRPVLREFDPRRIQEIEGRVAKATALTISMARPAPTAEQLPCHTYAANWRAIAGLSPPDMAYYVAILQAVAAADRDIPRAANQSPS